MSMIRPTLVALILLSVLLGGAYPLVTTLAADALFAHEAAGSIMHDKNGKLVGSELIGQPFSDPKYFWGRLSATTPTAYNAAASTGTNYAVNNPALLDAAKIRIAALKAADPTNHDPIPVDLVTASGSGLDPHISVAAANYQVARVAKARRLSHAQVQSLVERFTEGRQFGVLGEAHVHVLKLNLALDGRL